ncbi:MAG: hypothetical protein ABR998_03960 [Gemmatimonadales bacterium]|jgi:hypothetical protein
MIARRHFAALLKVEVARQRRLALRLIGSTVALAAIFWLAGKRESGMFVAVALGTGFGAALIVPLGVTRDRLDGTLEFLSGLPASAATIAAARFAAVVIVTLPWALASAAATLLVSRAAGGALPPAAVVLGAFPLAWIGLTIIGWMLTGVFCRWDPAQLMGLPVVGFFVVLLVAGHVLRGVLGPNPQPWLTSLLERPWATAVLLGGFLMLGAAAGYLSYLLAVNAIARYRRDPAAL